MRILGNELVQYATEFNQAWQRVVQYAEDGGAVSEHLSECGVLLEEMVGYRAKELRKAIRRAAEKSATD